MQLTLIKYNKHIFISYVPMFLSSLEMKQNIDTFIFSGDQCNDDNEAGSFNGIRIDSWPKNELAGKTNMSYQRFPEFRHTK